MKPTIDSILHILTPGVLIAIFSFFMVSLAIMERLSVRLFDTFKDFKPTIVSLGILGTFIGIFSGLWYFDTEDISGSVPSLLEGLKVAFVTSIIGMLIVSFLTVWEKLSKRAQGDDEAEIMQSMNQSLLDLKENSKNGFKSLHEQMLLLNKQNADKLSALVKATNNGFAATNASLQEAIKTLSKGATEEIIKALQSVISDFNQNLTEQFGDNFKELNQACLKLVQWQEEYRKTVDKNQEQIDRLLHSFNQVDSTLEKIQKRNEETKDVYEKLSTIIETMDKQINSMTELLGTYQSLSADADNMFQTIKNRLSETSSHMEEFATATRQSIDRQLEAFGGLNEEMTQFSTEIRQSINAQASSLRDLTQELENQLQTSLEKLEESLTALTKEFAQNYETFLKRYQDVKGAQLHEEE